MQYHLVFDATQVGYGHWSYLEGILLFAASAVGVAWYNRSSGGRLGSSRSKQWVLMLCLFSIFAAVLFFPDYRNYLSLQSALRESKCQIAEGIVTNFHLVTRRNHADEVFSVSGHRFEYWDGGGQNGFHQSGIIRDGLPVRIFFVGADPHSDIVRLETAQ